MTRLLVVWVALAALVGLLVPLADSHWVDSAEVAVHAETGMLALEVERPGTLVFGPCTQGHAGDCSLASCDYLNAMVSRTVGGQARCEFYAHAIQRMRMAGGEYGQCFDHRPATTATETLDTNGDGLDETVRLEGASFDDGSIVLLWFLVRNCGTLPACVTSLSFEQLRCDQEPAVRVVVDPVSAQLEPRDDSGTLRDERTTLCALILKPETGASGIWNVSIEHDYWHRDEST